MSAPGSDPRFAKLVRDFVALATEHSEQLTDADDVKENLNGNFKTFDNNYA